MGGGMEAHKNKWVEDWGTARENLEHNFRWTRRNLAIVGLFGIAIPYVVYKGIVREFDELKPIKNIKIKEELKRWICWVAGILLFMNHFHSEHMQDEDNGRPYRKFM